MFAQKEHICKSTNETPKSAATVPTAKLSATLALAHESTNWESYGQRLTIQGGTGPGILEKTCNGDEIGCAMYVFIYTHTHARTHERT